MSKPKRGRGRPKTELTDLPKDWKEIIAREAAEGAGITEIRATIGVFGNEAHKRLMEENEEYSHAIKKGLEISELWWLKQGRVNLKDTKFNSTLWYMNMKNRFGWKDKTEHSMDPENPFRMIEIKRGA